MSPLANIVRLDIAYFRLFAAEGEAARSLETNELLQFIACGLGHADVLHEKVAGAQAEHRVASAEIAALTRVPNGIGHLNVTPLGIARVVLG